MKSVAATGVALWQEPGLRMKNHNMLTIRGKPKADMENSAMSEDRSDSAKARQAGSVSVFRPGQVAQTRLVNVDLEPDREYFTGWIPRPLVIPARVWESLTLTGLDADFLARNGLFLHSSSDPVCSAFDILRTRLLHGLAQKGWRRVAITSPTHGCGKSFVAANLALSLARRPESRTVLVDFDLRRPQLAQLLGIGNVAPLSGYLSGDRPLEAQFHRVERRLALGLNGTPVDDPATLLHSPETAVVLEAMMEQLDPDVALYDMPPALVCDDLLALSPDLDAVLLVTDGTRTSPDEIRACEQQFEGRLPLLGVVLNRSQDRKLGRYRYGKD